MDAALRHLEADGVLAGLNLRAVADDAGVTPANVYHLFGGRQGLLRSALGREARRLEVPIAESSSDSFVERRLRMFDAIVANPRLALSALLALDHDPDFVPLPYLDSTRNFYGDLVARGELSAELDVDAAHVVTIAATVGIVLFVEAAARQIDAKPGELLDRARAVMETMLDGLVG
jgi:TetR/AcrR family transcriptional regulator, repressor for neighboring sulfatase